MNPDIFSEWLRRQGHRVVKSHSSYWYDASPRVYQAFPYHWLIQPTDEELNNFLLGNGAIGLRYSTPVDNPVGRISYHVVYEAEQYTIEMLERRSRQNVRTGLSRCRVEQIPFERLAEEGWLLETDTARRQGRKMKMDKNAWSRRYLSAAELPGFEAWGALIENRLVASLLAFQMDDCCELISQQCHSEFITARVNNALAFTVTQTMMNRPGIRSIFYTLQSLDAPPSVDEFKFRMNYVARKVRQRVMFHPLLAPAIGPLCHAAVKKLMQWNPGNPTFPKVEGMLRFYIEGKRPLSKQHWPECLVGIDERMTTAQ